MNEVRKFIMRNEVATCRDLFLPMANSAGIERRQKEDRRRKAAERTEKMWRRAEIASDILRSVFGSGTIICIVYIICHLG